MGNFRGLPVLVVAAGLLLTSAFEVYRSAPELARISFGAALAGAGLTSFGAWLALEISAYRRRPDGQNEDDERPQ